MKKLTDVHLKWPLSLYTRRNKVFIISFPKEKFKKACENYKSRDNSTKLDYIKSVGLMNMFTRNAQKNILSKLTLKKIDRHEMIYKEGDRADRIYFVINGQFKITKKIVVINKETERVA